MAHITKEELRLAVDAGYARGMVDGLYAAIDAASRDPQAIDVFTILMKMQKTLRGDKAHAMEKLLDYRDARKVK